MTEESEIQRLCALGWRPYTDGTFIGHISSIYTRMNGEIPEFGILTRDAHRNLSGAVHGGILMAMFDRAMGAQIRRLHPDRQFATASMTVDFLRSVRIGEFIGFDAIVTKSGRKAVFMRGEAMVADRLVGSANALFMMTG